MSEVRIPARLVIPYLEQLVASCDESAPDEIAAEVLGVKTDTLWKYMSGRTARFEFDFVDLLFCKLGNPIGLWQQPEFEEYYTRVLPQCARPGCNNPLPLLCGTRRKYCCRNCKDRDGDHRRGDHHDIQTHCRNGHRRTPGNTDKLNRCKICARKARRKSMKKPEVRAAYRAYMREYRARKRQEAAV